jgi:hypothetical protein
MDDAFTYLEGTGSELESDYKYKGTDGTCTYDKSKAQVTPKAFVDVEKTDAGLTEALQTGPVSIAVAANTFWQL